MALRVKSGHYGARLSEIAAIAVLFMVVDQVLTELGIHYQLNSGLEGKHQPKSLHYPGHAFDFKLLNVLEEEGQNAAKEISKRLGDDFDAVYTETKKIIHVEWQMKTPLGRL